MVYLQPFCRNSVLKCVSQLEITKKSLKQLMFGVHGRFRSLTFMKFVTSACYDKQHVCVYDL